MTPAPCRATAGVRAPLTTTSSPSGICGSCGLMINGIAHGPEQTTTCQLHMRSFSLGAAIAGAGDGI
ncbi:hypothetical protein [Modestobacter sp. DSM 44400]|uniref:hypothetical protein n=1 Tax=Modestobacter sp. DSM 44400 TaxID=1550230 RepID=UPI0020C8D891|nr:hypothetical protein [Modestobacter sp. DSM 44400]